MSKETLYCEMSTITFRKCELTVPYLFYRDEHGEEYTTTRTDEITFRLLGNAYREKNSIPFPDEIMALRERYGLSALKMSRLLGFGDNQYRLYENGEIPSLSNAKMISGIEDVSFFEKLVAESGDLFSEKELQKLNKRINLVRGNIQEEEKNILYRDHPKEKSRYNGYVSPVLQKLEQLVIFFAGQLNGVFETKLNKLLFYTDFMHYKLFGMGVSGLRYQAITYGPVPVHYGTLYENLEHLHKDVVDAGGGYVGSMIYADVPFEPDCFSTEELQTMHNVLERFKDSSATGISRISHNEKAWRENHEKRAVINYADAFELTV